MIDDEYERMEREQRYRIPVKALNTRPSKPQILIWQAKTEQYRYLNEWFAAY
jgi:hypothetical protein